MENKVTQVLEKIGFKKYKANDGTYFLPSRNIKPMKKIKMKDMLDAFSVFNDQDLAELRAELDELKAVKEAVLGEPQSELLNEKKEEDAKPKTKPKTKKSKSKGNKK